MDVHRDQNDNQMRLSDEDLASELRIRLDDLSDLPPDHELIRWIHATSVIININFKQRAVSIKLVLMLKFKGRSGYV